MIHTHSRILFSLTIGNSVTCDNTDEAVRRYAKSNKPGTERYTSVISFICLHEAAKKKSQLIQIESRMSHQRRGKRIDWVGVDGEKGLWPTYTRLWLDWKSKFWCSSAQQDDYT